MAAPASHPSVLRVQNRLAELAVPGQVRVLDGSARTAADAAAALGVEVGQIASSLLFVTVPGGPEPGDDEAAGEPILVLTSGANRVDMTRVASLLGVPDLDRPRADVVKKVTGFAIGGVAPIAHPAPIRTLIDVSLARFDVVWAAAGHPHAVFPTRYDELVRITGGTPAEVA